MTTSGWADVNAEFVGKTPGFEVIGRAHTAQAAYEAVLNLSPELVLLDLYLPDEFGLDLLQRLRTVDTPPHVIVITAAKDVLTVQQAVRLGVSAAEPDMTADMVLEALRASQEPLSAAEIATRSGLSRPTVQRHLSRLWERHQVVRTLQYGSTGRPTHLYSTD
jgi:response regulator of citrate/malate metabolism